MQILLINANCQGVHLEEALHKLPWFTDHFEIARIAYEDMNTALENPAPLIDRAGRATIFWEQVTDTQPEQRAQLASYVPKSARRIRFPALTCASLWPFAAMDSRTPEPPARNYGTYADFVALRVARDIAASNRNPLDLEAVPDSELLDRYHTAAQKFLPPPENLLARDHEQWQQRDRDADIQMSPYLEANLTSQRLFWTSGRTTWAPLHHMLTQLLQASFPDLFRLPDLLAQLTDITAHYRANDSLSAPIYPRVAESLGLAWFDPTEKTRFYRHRFSFDEWITRCIRAYPYMA